VPTECVCLEESCRGVEDKRHALLVNGPGFSLSTLRSPSLQTVVILIVLFVLGFLFRCLVFEFASLSVES